MPRRLTIGRWLFPGHRSRSSFKVFLFLAHQFLQASGTAIVPEHAELCAASVLEAAAIQSRSTIWHRLRRLRDTYRVIQYEAVRRRRPRVRLRPVEPWDDVVHPRHNIRFDEGWSGQK